MINLTPFTSSLDIPELSLSDIFSNTLSKHQSIRGVEYNYHDGLKVRDRIGNADLNAADLIYYPALARALRKISGYPFYTMHIHRASIKGLNDSSITGTINALRTLQETIRPYRQEKAALDAYVNNLIMIHGQSNTMPIYTGAKPHYARAYHRKNNRRIAKYFFYLSGVRYFSQRYHYYQSNHDDDKICNLVSQHLIDTFRETTTWDHEDFNDIGNIVGGITNTPIIIMRCARSANHVGRLFYYDLHTQRMYATKTEARCVASKYTLNHNFDIFEGKL